LEQERPSVIFCDLIMPNVDGWEFRRLQQESPTLASIPFVVVSASLAADDEAQNLAADMVLHKPVDIDDIIRCAQRYDRGPIPRVERDQAKRCAALRVRNEAVGAH
jgi:CheY-like chemotaxis protein